MPYLFWILTPAALLVAIAVLLRRRAELAHYRASLAERAHARARGSHQARLQHPSIDLQKCIGCGACIRACPEDGVLALAYGQAVVVHGARCVGHGRCAEACPTAAIALTLGDLSSRSDLPAIDDRLEAVTVPGLFLAGEITGFALVRTAVQHGVQVAREVARRVAAAPAAASARPATRLPHASPARVPVAAGGRTAGGEAAAPAPSPRDARPPYDVVIVGLGPAGLACALQCTADGLRFLGLEQAAEIGGTVAAYPRKKLVMTQPMDLPLHGRLARLDYSKEELVELWRGLASEHRLPVKTGVVVQRVERDAATGTFRVVTDQGSVRARHVVLALGRRGSPRKLGVPGEDQAKVAYALLDAESYQHRHALVVGGGDSAIEAALALAEQGTNTVAISYRKEAFFRLKARNEARLQQALGEGRLQVLFGSEVTAIGADTVTLQVALGGEQQTIELPNDEVFVFAGGTPPFPLLEAAGVSFDPALRPQEEPLTDRGAGLLAALVTTLGAVLALLALRIALAGYYDLDAAGRSASPWHDVLRPAGTVGLWGGVLAATLFAANLLYLVRRSLRLGRVLPGSLRGWMSAHVATGLAALLCAGLHSGFHVRDSVGGHALLAMAVVVAAGIVGRWFYAFVPRVQNGRQADLEEIGTQVTAIAGEWDQQSRGFGATVRARIEALATGVDLGHGFVRRVLALLQSQWRLRRQLAELRALGAAEGVPAQEVAHVLLLAQRAHRLALQLAHYEEVRALLATWRWLHRWLALLLLLLVVLHVVTAVRWGGVDLATLFGASGDPHGGGR